LSGDVIIFKYPLDPSVFFIKRIIGLPYERVVVEDGIVKVYAPGNSDPHVVHEEYLTPGVATLGRQDLVLEDGQFFVMGDNRSASFDSRNWGAVPRRDIVGLVRLRILPITEAQAFHAPEYSF